jgi:hypothetical protein
VEHHEVSKHRWVRCIAGHSRKLARYAGQNRIECPNPGKTATAIRGGASSLAEKLAEKSGVDPDPELKLEFPSKLEPSAKISAARLSKFADFLDQLQAWFSSQDDAEFPEGSSQAVQSVHGALAQVCAAIDSLLTPIKTPETPPPTVDNLIGEIDDSPVLEVDTNARLILEDHQLKPLVQTFQGVNELTAGAKETLEDFLAKQDIKIEGQDLRRLHDKMLKWIEGIPLGQVLVIKLSGLTGKPNVYSSYQPKGGAPVKEEEEDA